MRFLPGLLMVALLLGLVSFAVWLIAAGWTLAERSLPEKSGFVTNSVPQAWWYMEPECRTTRVWAVYFYAATSRMTHAQIEAIYTNQLTWWPYGSNDFVEYRKEKERAR